MSSSSYEDDEASTTRTPFVNRKPKYPTKYHEELQPLSPSTVLPVKVNQANSKTSPNAELQEHFLNLLLRGSNADQVESFLRSHSENVDVNQYDSMGRTPLHRACLADECALVEVLTRFGADVRLTTRDGFNLFHLASFVGSSRLFNLLISLKR